MDFQDKRGFEADIYNEIRENQRAKRPRPIWLFSGFSDRLLRLPRIHKRRVTKCGAFSSLHKASNYRQVLRNPRRWLGKMQATWLFATAVRFTQDHFITNKSKGLLFRTPARHACSAGALHDPAQRLSLDQRVWASCHSGRAIPKLPTCVHE